MFFFEGFTQAKNPDAPNTNEDRIVAIPGRVYAVIDGATDLSGLRYDDRLGQGATGGYLAAQAVAEALAIVGAGSFSALPEPSKLISTLNGAIAATYKRIGVADQEIQSGRQRFRAGFSSALVTDDIVRLVALGDCGLRLNGKAVLEHQFAGDIVLSKARSVAWSILVDKGLDVDVARPLARRLIVEGMAKGKTPPAPLTDDDLTAILASVRSDTGVLAACDNNASRIDMILGAGLEGIRSDPSRFDALVLDGVSDPATSVRVLDVPMAQIKTLELSSDGYPAQPNDVSIAAWEDLLAEADKVDPDRIGRFASTKGRAGKNFGDDRSILIVSAGKF